MNLRPRLIAFTFLAVALAWLVRWLLDPLFGDQFPFVTFVLAVTFIAWLGGFRYAIGAMVLGYFLASYFFLPPRFSFAIAPGTNVTAAALYIVICIAIAIFGENMHATQRRIAAQTELLRTTLSSIADGVITTDLRGRITNMNAVAESLTGWSNDAATGMALEKVFRIVSESTREPVESPVVKALREEIDVGVASRSVLIARDGAERFIDDNAAPIRDADGRIVGGVLIFRDVAARRNLEQETRERMNAVNFLAAVVESSDDAIVSKSLDGTIRTWNAAAERLFQYPAEEAVGRHISLIIPPDRSAEEDRILSVLRGGGHVEHFETVRVRRDGQPVHVSLSISPIRDENGVVVGASKIARDISERHMADRRKDEFLATLAHELRNPLAPISAGLQVMQRARNNPVAIESARSMMERQLSHMVRLVNDLLDVSRISRGKIELHRERVAVATVLEHAVETSRPAIDAGRHVLQVTLPSEPLYVDGDLTRLGQVFTNLLTNAAKYTPPGGTILLSAVREADQVVIGVRDSGIGIPADMLARVFDMFTQLHASSDKSHGGLGIGLTLVRRLVEMHGGVVAARSEGKGRGSEFSVRLPMASAPSPAEQLDATESPSGIPHTRRILVVDDNIDSAESLAALLRLTNHDVRVAYSGDEAMRVAADFRPGVLLMDIGMPGLTGYEVCERIRQEPWGRDALVIAMTGWSQTEDRRRSHEAGFDHHLVKPLDLAALEALLDGPAELKSA